MNDNNNSYIIDWSNEYDHVSLVENCILIDKMINLARSNKAGAVSTFLGTTRDTFEDKIVTHLSYEAYNEMAIECMKEICNKIRLKWNVIKIVIQHKIGECPIGEISVLIAISSAHRGESLQAVQYAIDELKRSVPIWKKEFYKNNNDNNNDNNNNIDNDSNWKINNEFELWKKSLQDSS